MPTYSVVSIGTAVSGSGGPLTVTPGTHATGDLLLLCGAGRSFGSGSSTDPSGYDLIKQGSDVSIEIWGRKAASSSEGSVQISFGGSNRQIAYIVALRSSDGWSDFTGAVSNLLVDSNTGASTVTSQRYRSLTVTENNLCIFQLAKKVTTNGGATAISVTSGFTAAGFGADNTLTAGLLISSQIQGQGTKANIVQADETVTGNSDSNGSFGISISLRSSPPASTPTPTVGALSISGLAPTIIGQRPVFPGVGSISIQGLTPVTTPGQLAPNVSALSLSGYAPEIIQQTGPNAGTGTAILVINGLAPTLGLNRVITPQLPTLAGDSANNAPTILTEWTAKPTPAALTLQGALIGNLIKDGSVRVSPAVGTLTLTGNAAVVAVPFDGNLAPIRAQLDLLGLAPEVIANWILAPTPDLDPETDEPLLLTLMGFAPTLRGRIAWHDSDAPRSATWRSG